MRRMQIFAAGAAVIALGGIAIAYWPAPTEPVVVQAAVVTPLATPSGVTIQSLEGANLNISAYGSQGVQYVYADARGMTLYTSDTDREIGKSACNGECGKTWLPLLAASDATAHDDWSLVSRDDGRKQWALKGKPLYTFVKDAHPADVGGNPPPMLTAAQAALFGLPAPKQDPLPAGWHAASFQPADGLALPFGIDVRELNAAKGQVFVDIRGMTLYVFNGDAKHDATQGWKPLNAGQMANPIGDWALINRDDGIHQWSYKGRPIYTFDGDLKPGDVTGVGHDDKHEVAMLERYFTPAGVIVSRHPGRGPLLTTADGRTLYRRDSHVFRSGGHSLGSALPYHPAVGRNIGTQGCDRDCLKSWHPFVAPSDAVPTGYWDVVARDDGTKQWAYRGFALYTYDGDKKRGDNNGNDIFDILVNDGVHQVAQAQIGPPQDDAFALFWHNAEP